MNTSLETIDYCEMVHHVSNVVQPCILHSSFNQTMSDHQQLGATHCTVHVLTHISESPDHVSVEREKCLSQVLYCGRCEETILPECERGLLR